MLTENHCNMYYTIHFTIVIASSYATSADAVDDSLQFKERKEEKESHVQLKRRKEKDR